MKGDNFVIDIKQNQCVFIIGPHVDDGELGCGGTLARLVAANNDVHFVVFSLAKKSIPSEFPKDSTKKELYQSMETLNIPKENVHLYDYEVRTFPKVRQDILENLIELKKEFSPEIVFTPSLHDLHQDHEVVAKETLRAFKKSVILCYEEPWNIISFDFTALIKLSEANIKKKIQALQCYKSQAHRDYFKEDAIYNLAKSRGSLIEHKYAEAFEVIRLII